MPTDPPRPRGVTCETELVAMTRYARRLEANIAVRRFREGVPDVAILAAIEQEREQFGVTEAMRRLFGDRKTQRET